MSDSKHERWVKSECRKVPSRSPINIEISTWECDYLYEGYISKMSVITQQNIYHVQWAVPENL